MRGFRKAVAPLLMLLAFPALAQDRLTVGALTAPTSLDPHFHSSAPNNQALRQIYDTLTRENADGTIGPGLATSWRTLDDLTWEFTLREGVTFTDGVPFTAEDVLHSFRRIPEVPNSPGPFTPFVRAIERAEAVGPHTLRIRTRAPNPFLDWEFAQLMVVSARPAAETTTARFNAGEAAIGTGPYRLVSFTPGERLVLRRNPGHWGPAPDWEEAEFRYIANNGARVAGLLAGDLDLIDNVPIASLPTLEANGRVRIFSGPGYGVVYLFPDSVREETPHVTGRDGQPLRANPLRDPRVRQALSLSLSRTAIVERVMSGRGVPADQFAGPTVPDRARGLPPLPYDPDAARRLLREAGYPNGFRMTIHGPAGFFPSDASVIQAVAQGFTRIGVETTVQTLPPATYFTEATNRRFSLFMTTLSSAIGANALRQVAMTRNAENGDGPFNRQHYSNPRLDELVRTALRTVDPPRRLEATAEAMRELNRDLGVIPVFFLNNNWAALADRVEYEPNPVGYTQATRAKRRRGDATR